MPAWRKAVFEENLSTIGAWQTLNNPEHTGALRSDALYDLVLEATGDKEMARKMAKARSTVRQRAGLPV